MIATEGVGRFLEVGTRYVADGKGDVPLCVRLPDVSGAGLEEVILAPPRLKDVDSGLVVTVQVDELVHEVRSPQLECLCHAESLEMVDEGFVVEYSGRDGGVIGSPAVRPLQPDMEASMYRCTRCLSSWWMRNVPSVVGRK